MWNRSMLIAFGLLLMMLAGVATVHSTGPANANPAPADEPEPPLTLSIAVPEHHGHRSLNLDTEHFHVVLTNVSRKPVRLWTEAYSWGYGNLAFEIIDDAGEVTRVEKKMRVWDKDVPDYLTLHPGGHHVINVDFFKSDQWKNPPARPKDDPKPRTIEMRAVYEIQPDSQSRRLGVWTGKIVSPAKRYAIW